MTLRHLALAAVSAALVSTPLVGVVAPGASAGGYGYDNCDALHRDYPHGVAKSAQAAAKQVRDGYGRPSTTKRAKKVYAANKGSLDRDKDGTACEA